MRAATGRLSRWSALGAALAFAYLGSTAQSQVTDSGPVAPASANAPGSGAADAVGAAVYSMHCASCHGADYKGVSGKHVPDLTDAAWLTDGEDSDTGQMRPSDVEKVVRFGIRSGHESARLAVPMLAWSDPASPTHGLTTAEVDDVTSFVLFLSDQPFDRDSARRGKALFNGKGSCFDCHGSDAAGDSSIGATDLTHPDGWLYGRDGAAIRASIVEGRAGVSPAFEGQLTPDEIRAVSAHVYGKAAGYDF